ncbi:LOW QUALITY PROTEIN: hypothetical protein HID58_078006, partial [Brassica napus]
AHSVRNKITKIPPGNTKELRVGRGCCGSRCLHNDKWIDKFLSFKRNRWQRPPAEKEVQNHSGCELKNSKIPEVKKPVRFYLDDHELEPKGEVSGRKRGGGGSCERLSFTHVVDQIASVSVHQLQVDVVVVTLEAFMSFVFMEI